MTESVITISPKTSPYRSQISTRAVSPNPSSVNLSRHRNLDQNAFSNEKLQLKKLNDQFLSYIERVRIFETYNNCLTIHCEQIQTAQDRTKTKLDSLKQEFNEYQEEKSLREKKDLELENENIHQAEKQINDFKNKQKVCQHEHDLYRKQIIDLQKTSIDLQAKTDELRFEYENLNDDNNHYRKHMTYYQLLKSSILDEISRQRDMHQRLQIEVEDLKMQNQISSQTHEADIQAVEIHNDNLLYDLTTNFRFDGNGKNPLTQMLNEIREEYQTKDNDMREELHRKYLYEYNQHIKKQVDQNFLDTNREDIERRHLSNELNSLNDNRTLLQQKLILIQEHYKQLEINCQKEVKRQKDMEEKYDHQIKNLRVSVQEYENLLSNNSLIRQPTLDDEVNKYRQLLEGSAQQIGLRQLIHMPNKIDRFLPISRPTTPPPPPSPVNKSEPTPTLLLLPSLTRQNSISENSYDTAPISQSSTTTTTTNNQQYLTLDSVNDKIFHSDYDTDNDQSQTIQYMSGRSSRLISETDTTTPTAMTPADQESLPPLPPDESINHDQTVIEITIDTSHTDDIAPINETLPFITMNIVSQVDTDENKNIVSDEQQSPLISTFEKREEVEKANIESTVLIPSASETIIPITIDVDSKPTQEPIELKTISPSTPMMSADEQQSKPTVSPIPISNQPEPESTVVEVPISSVVEVPVSTLPATNPLAKLISTMLPNAIPFTPSSNGATINRPVSPSPLSAMNNDATPFIPNQYPHGSGQQQQHMSNMNTGHWNGPGARGGGGGGGPNRRGQSGGGGGFHHGGGGNQRSGGGGNWQQGGGGNQKARRGLK